MEFEWDRRKSESNEARHGIGFSEARALWEDEWRLATRVERAGERRELLIARHGGTCWAAIYTMRGDRVCIISVRRATRKEVAYYDRKRNEWQGA